MKRIYSDDEWRDVLTKAVRNAVSPMELARITGKSLSAVVNAERRFAIYLNRKQPQQLSKEEWISVLKEAKNEDLTAGQLSRKINVEPYMIYAAENRYDIKLRRTY